MHTKDRKELKSFLSEYIKDYSAECIRDAISEVYEDVAKEMGSSTSQGMLLSSLANSFASLNFTIRPNIVTNNVLINKNKP